MKFLRKLLLNAITFIGIIAPFNNHVEGAKAATIGVDIDYTSDSFAYVYNLPENGDLAYATINILFAFDEVESVNPIETINRMGFRVTYLKPTNIFHHIGNWWNNLWGNPPTNGTKTTVDMIIKANTIKSFEIKQMSTSQLIVPGPTYEDKSKLSFPSIGKMSQLFEAEDYARRFGSEIEFKDWYKKNALTGGPYYKPTPNDRINDNAFAYAHRKWYAIVPIPWAEEIAPESIDCYLMDGTHVKDGLNEEGDPYVEETGPNAGSKYIDAVVSQNYAFAINGNDAKLKKIEVSGYTSGNNTIVTISNGGVDMTTKQPINLINNYRFASNVTQTLDWNIKNDNRYIYIFWEGNDTSAQQIKIRFYYESSSNAWFINLKKDGEYFPDPIVPQRPQPGINLNFNDLLIAIGIALGLILIIAIAYDFLKTAILRR